MDISAALLKGTTLKEVASETGDTLRSVQFDFPPADVWIPRTPRRGRLQQLSGHIGSFEGHVGTERCSTSIRHEA
eukprot:2817554-Prorocentrum_lima.AAC.1